MQVTTGMIIAANIIDFIASMVQIWSGVVKEKKKILFWQNIQLGLQTVSLSLLGGFSGAISNVLSIGRNIFCYFDKATWPVKIGLIAAQFVLTYFFGGGGAISYLPFVVCTVYILFMTVKDPIRFKLLSTLTFIPWVFYFLYYRSYTGATFAAITVVTSSISLYQMIQKRKKDQETS